MEKEVSTNIYAVLQKTKQNSDFRMSLNFSCKSSLILPSVPFLKPSERQTNLNNVLEINNLENCVLFQSLNSTVITKKIFNVDAKLYFVMFKCLRGIELSFLDNRKSWQRNLANRLLWKIPTKRVYLRDNKRRFLSKNVCLTQNQTQSRKCGRHCCQQVTDCIYCIQQPLL